MPNGQEPAPDRIPLKEIQARRLAAVSGIAADELRNQPIATLAEKLRFRIDPSIFLFTRVCGKVVKKDPVTGVEYPVPFATVHVEDTDCSFLGYFPPSWPWVWFFPFACTREEVGTATTDACGNFCVNVPRFEVDWILRWRKEHFCPPIFIKPWIRDILEDLLRPEPLPPIPPRPEPPVIGPRPGLLTRPPVFAPGVLPGLRPPVVQPPEARRRGLLTDAGLTMRRVDGLLGSRVATMLASVEAPDVLGPSVAMKEETLSAPAFPEPVPPPVPVELQELAERGAMPELANRLRVDPEMLKRVNLGRYIGPFPRCFDIVLPEWTPVLDVPDVTFRVTQDVDGDGTEEVVYSEGYFDVRWDAGPIGPVTLYASPAARSAPVCETPPNLGPCAQPSIDLAGTLPLVNPTGPGTFPFMNTTTGYAVRPNRPHSSGRESEVPLAATAAQSPFAGRFPFWGCAHQAPGGQPASFYRILYRTSTDDGATWSPPVPVVESWSQFRTVGSPPVLEWKDMSTTDGWYEVIDDAEGWLPGSRLLLWWSPPSGFHELVLELGDAGKTLIHTASPVRIRADNSAPQGQYLKLEYRRASDPDFQQVSLTCPTIDRGGQPLQLRVSFMAWATHMRSISIGAAGCGGATPVLVQGFEPFQSPPGGPPSATYWHRHAADNSFSNGGSPATNAAVWSLDPATHPQGAYNIIFSAYSRAFNPNAGFNFTPPSPDVTYNPAPIWRSFTLPVAIID